MNGRIYLKYFSDIFQLKRNQYGDSAKFVSGKDVDRIRYRTSQVNSIKY